MNNSVSSKSDDQESLDEDKENISSKSGRLLNSPSTRVSLESDRACRLLFLGAECVGKTSIIRRFINDVSSTPSGGTLQEMYSGALSFVSGDVPNVNFTIEDTGGQYSADFPAMLPISVREADVVVLVFSLTQPETFDEISLLRDTVTAVRPDVPLLVVGNKSDLIRKVPFYEMVIDNNQ